MKRPQLVPHLDHQGLGDISLSEYARTLLEQGRISAAREVCDLNDTVLPASALAMRIKNDRLTYQLNLALNRPYIADWSGYARLSTLSSICDGDIVEDIAILLASKSTGKIRFLNSIFREHSDHFNCEIKLLVSRELINFNHPGVASKLLEVSVDSERLSALVKFYQAFVCTPGELHTRSELVKGVRAYLTSPSVASAERLMYDSLKLIDAVKREYFAVDVLLYTSRIILDELVSTEGFINPALRNLYTDAAAYLYDKYKWYSFFNLKIDNESISEDDFRLFGVKTEVNFQAYSWLAGYKHDISWKKNIAMLTRMKNGLDSSRFNDRWIMKWLEVEEICLDHSAGLPESQHFVLGRDQMTFDAANARAWVATAKAMIRAGSHTIARVILDKLSATSDTLPIRVGKSIQGLNSVLDAIDGLNTSLAENLDSGNAGVSSDSQALPSSSLQLKDLAIMAFSDEALYMEQVAAQLRKTSIHTTPSLVPFAESFLDRLVVHHGVSSLTVFMTRYVIALNFAETDPRLSVRQYRLIRQELSHPGQVDVSFRWALAVLEALALNKLGNDSEVGARIAEELDLGFADAPVALVTQGINFAITSYENIDNNDEAYRLSVLAQNFADTTLPTNVAVDLCLNIARVHESRGLTESSIEWLLKAEQVFGKQVTSSRWIHTMIRLAKLSDQSSKFVQAAKYWSILSAHDARSADYYSRRAIASTFQNRLGIKSSALL